jgi:hypothetical protein
MSGGPARDTLADILERVLDKGIVIVGDIVVSIVDIELLTLKLRLFISSADTALHMGLDWWRHDPFFSGQQGADARDELERLQARVAELEARLPDSGSGHELDEPAARNESQQGQQLPAESGVGRDGEEASSADETPPAAPEQPGQAQEAAGKPEQDASEASGAAPSQQSDRSPGESG